MRDAYQKLFWDREPREVLGGSIYLYDWPLPNIPTAPPSPTSAPRATGSQ
jgi:hypothetical protein